MAQYRLSVSVASRKDGRCSVSMAAYRASVALKDARTGTDCDYTRKQGVLHTEIVLPANAPAWAEDRGELWNRVEAAERRGDAIVAREIQLSLPHELPHETRRDLALDFAGHIADKYGLAVDCAIHAPSRDGDERNHHAHLLICQRPFDETGREGFGNKSRVFDPIAQKRAGEEPIVDELREYWALTLNQALDRAGVRDSDGATVMVDHRSFDRRGIDREPTIKEGVAATGIERRGEHSDRAAENDNIRERNAEREELTQQIAATESELAGLISDARRTPLYDQMQWRFRGVPEMAALFEADAAAERDQAQGRGVEIETDAAPSRSAHSPDPTRYRAARELNEWLQTQTGEPDWDYSLDTGKDNGEWLRELVLQLPYEHSEAPSSRFLWNVASMPDKPEPPQSEDAEAWDEVRISHWLRQALYHLPEEERSRPAGRFLQHVSDSLQERLEREGPRHLADSAEPSTLPEIDPFGPAARFLKAAAALPDAEAQPEETRAGDAEPISATETIRRGLPDAERNRTARELNEWLNEPAPREPNPLADQPESDPARRLMEKVADMPERTEADDAQKRAEERRKMHEEIWGPPSETEGPAERFIQKQVFGGGDFHIS